MTLVLAEVERNIKIVAENNEKRGLVPAFFCINYFLIVSIFICEKKMTMLLLICNILGEIYVI